MHRNFLEEAATIDECITSPYRGSGGCSDENNVLKLIQHPEGQVLPDGANWEYQYFLKDHLGNVRITFTAKTQAATNYTTDFEASTNADFQNYSNTTFDLVDHTDAAGTVYQKVQWLNGGVNGRVGLAKSLAVMPGDQVSITAYAKYMNLGTTANPNAFITSLAAAFGVSSGSTGEALKIYNGLNSYANAVPGGDHYQDNESAPKAFVTIIFFDKDYNLIDAAWDQVTTTGAQTSPTVKQPPHDVMSISAKAPEAGYAFVFVSNEHFNYVDVYFDDVTVGHTPSPIVSTSDYFPFGLSYNSTERAGSLEQKYMYNGKELQDEMELNWYDYGARMYMPEIGRWGVIDKLAQKYPSISQYNYCFNNPVNWNDPDGNDPDPSEVKEYKTSETRISMKFDEKNNTNTVTEQVVTMEGKFVPDGNGGTNFVETVENKTSTTTIDQEGKTTNSKQTTSSVTTISKTGDGIKAQADWTGGTYAYTSYKTKGQEIDRMNKSSNSKFGTTKGFNDLVKVAKEYAKLNIGDSYNFAFSNYLANQSGYIGADRPDIVGVTAPIYRRTVESNNTLYYHQSGNRVHVNKIPSNGALPSLYQIRPAPPPEETFYKRD